MGQKEERLKKIDPTIFGLSPRTEIIQIRPNHFQIIKNRKSRIIMADGKIILKQVKAIKQKHPQAKVSFKTNAPMCSKTTLFLNQEQIEISKI